MGKGALAIRVGQWFLASAEHTLDRVVPVVPEPQWTDSLADWADENGVEVVRSGDYVDIPADARLDLVFSVFYDRIVDPGFIARTARILNLHNAPLPRYRGVSPINWALKNRERMHGVSIHEITEEIDAGPVVAQVTFPIDPDVDEVIDVYLRSLSHGWALFEDTMPRLSRIKPRPQRPDLATRYTLLDNERLGERRSFTREQSGEAVAE
jgi:methionyl-tRNA formyltransferase